MSSCFLKSGLAPAVPWLLQTQISTPHSGLSRRWKLVSPSPTFIYSQHSSQAYPMASHSCLLLSSSSFCLRFPCHAGEPRMACRAKPETLQGEKSRRGKGNRGEGHQGVGMEKKKEGEEEKRNAHCTFQMDGKWFARICWQLYGEV